MQSPDVVLEMLDLSAEGVQGQLRLGQEGVILPEVLAHVLLCGVQVVHARGVVADAAVKILDQLQVVVLVVAEELPELAQGGLQAVHVRTDPRGAVRALLEGGGAGRVHSRPVGSSIVGAHGALQESKLRFDVPDGVRVGLGVQLRGTEPPLNAIDVIPQTRHIGACGRVGLLALRRQLLQVPADVCSRPRQILGALRRLRVPAAETVDELLDLRRLLGLLGKRPVRLLGARAQRAEAAMEVLVFLLQILHQYVRRAEVPGELRQVGLGGLVVNAEPVLLAVGRAQVVLDLLHVRVGLREPLAEGEELPVLLLHAESALLHAEVARVQALGELLDLRLDLPHVLRDRAHDVVHLEADEGLHAAPLFIVWHSAPAPQRGLRSSPRRGWRRHPCTHASARLRERPPRGG
mmetsp:Transcript_76073/g.240609  ORF Transcript_76073/g.240609 Transcript_76073/m.240609 type:complete len:407 (+) Transcript_76073:453-1673(+)